MKITGSPFYPSLFQPGFRLIVWLGVLMYFLAPQWGFSQSSSPVIAYSAPSCKAVVGLPNARLFAERDPLGPPGPPLPIGTELWLNGEFTLLPDIGAVYGVQLPDSSKGYIQADLLHVYLTNRPTPNDSSFIPLPEFAQSPMPLNFLETRKKITYPIPALQQGIDGKVILHIQFDEAGKYLRHIRTRVVHPLLASAVEQQLSELRFEPANYKGKAVPFWSYLPFDFRIAD